MSIKSFYTLTGRSPKCFNKLFNNYRYLHSNFFPKKYLSPLASVPIKEFKHSTLSQLHSLIANQENVSKESNDVLEVQPLQFEDVPFDEAVPHEHLIAALQKHNTVSDQMDCLVKTLSLSSEDVERRKEFCRTTEKLFKPFFNDFRIQMFGSTVNGFGFKGCDIDLTFETSAKENDMSCYLERPDVPLVSEVLSGKVSVQELSELPLREQLIFIHSVFLEYYKDSEVPAKFINAYVPLVRFYHDKYNLKCDLTMKNKVAYANTKLLYLFSNLDKRVILLMMTLRYWAKHTELIGKGLMFNTYTISLLVIYFLQTRSPPILPSAEYVLSLSDKFHTDDMEDKSFLDLLSKIPPSTNNQPIEELMKEFFFFYLYFDFTRVICPLTATSVPRDDFFSKLENNRFRMNSICVQDPLCLWHNVAELVDYKHCRKFFSELITICKIFQRDNIRDSANSFNLITLFDKPKEFPLQGVEKEKTVSFTLSLPDKISHSVDERSSAAERILHILQHVLLFECQNLEFDQIISLLQKQDKIVARQRQEWQEKYFFRVTQEETIPHLKNRRRKKNVSDEEKAIRFSDDESLTKEFLALQSNNKLILGAKCVVSKNTWLGRNVVDRTALPTTELLMQEKFISDKVAEQNALNLDDQKIKPFMFLFESYYSLSCPEKVIVIFRPLQKMSFNPILGIFLKEYIPNLMQKLNE